MRFRMTHAEFVSLLNRAKEAGGFDQVELAKRLGVAQSTISRWFQKQVPQLHRIAAVEKLVRDLTAGLTESGTKEEHIGEVEIAGVIGAGAEVDVAVEQVPPGGWGMARTKFPLPENSVAFEIIGVSMQPRYAPGDIIICPEKGTPLLEIPDGAEAALLLDDGRRFLKSMVRTDRPGRYHLTSPNADALIVDVSVRWAAHILMTIRADQWSRLSAAERRAVTKAAEKD